MVLEQFTVSLGIVFLNNLFFLFFATFSFFGYLSLNRIVFLNQINHSFLLIKFSLILAIFFLFGAIINLFSPLNDILVLLFYLIGIIIFIFKFKKKENIIELKWILLFFLFIFLYLYKSGNNNDFDYHSQHIELYKNYNLFNFNQNILDGRIKYNSSYLLLNSLTYLTNFFISIKLLSAFIFGLFILDVKNLIQNKISTYSVKIFSLFALICFFLALSKYKNIGTDYSAHLIYISLVLFYLTNFNVNKEFFNSKEFFFILCLILSLLIVFKISMILCSLILFHYLYIMHQKHKFLKVFSVFLFLPILIILIWLFQNYILSKCIIYPLSQLCFLDGFLLKQVIFEHNMINLFAKSVKINYWDQSIGALQEMNSIRYWLPFWLNDHFWKILEKFFPAILTFNIFSLKLLTWNGNKLILIANQKIFFLISFITFLIWFTQTPAMRFGFSYLILIFFIINIFFLKLFNLGLKEKLDTNYFSTTFNLFFGLMIFYQFVRIYSY